MNMIFHFCHVRSASCRFICQLILVKSSLVCRDVYTELYNYRPKKAWLSVQLCGATCSTYTFSEMSACLIQFRLVTLIWWCLRELSTKLPSQLNPAEWSLMLRSTIYNNLGSGEYVCVRLRVWHLVILQEYWPAVLLENLSIIEIMNASDKFLLLGQHSQSMQVSWCSSGRSTLNSLFKDTL